jgi:hypothetical protein
MQWQLIHRDRLTDTYAMEVVGVGCVVRVRTNCNDKLTEALTFVPGSKLVRDAEDRCHVVRGDA